MIDKNGRLEELARRMRAEKPSTERQDRGATWVAIGRQWLKINVEQRPNRPRRLLRIDLYQADKQTKVASFYRR